MSIAIQIAKALKEHLIEMAAGDNLPKDLNQLDPRAFYNALKPVEDMEILIRGLRMDAVSALNDDWDKSDEGFAQQVRDIDELVRGNFEKAVEFRVYLVSMGVKPLPEQYFNREGVNPLLLSDNEFRELSEAQGLVYSSFGGFAEAFNYGTSPPDTDSYMRTLPF